AAGAKEFGVAFSGEEFRAGKFLELRESAGVIEMSVTVQQDLYVAQLETKLLDVAFDLRRGFDKSTVENEMTLRGSDQVGSDFNCADIIEIPGDPKWRHRLVPTAARSVGLGKNAVEGEQNECDREPE